MEEMVIRVFAQCMLTPVIPSPAGDPRSLPDNAFVPPALNNHQGLWTLRDYHDEEIGVGKLIQQIGSGRKSAHFTVCLLLVLPHKEFWKKTGSRFRDWWFSQWWALLCGSSITRYCSHNQAINFTLVGHFSDFIVQLHVYLWSRPQDLAENRLCRCQAQGVANEADDAATKEQSPVP